jgi:hypothetical protein
VLSKRRAPKLTWTKDGWSPTRRFRVWRSKGRLILTDIGDLKTHKIRSKRAGRELAQEVLNKEYGG